MLSMSDDVDVKVGSGLANATSGGALRSEKSGRPPPQPGTTIVNTMNRNQLPLAPFFMLSPSSEAERGVARTLPLHAARHTLLCPHRMWNWFKRRGTIFFGVC